MFKVFPHFSSPYGASYSEWSKRWWRWMHTLPKEKNPAADDTGENADQNQRYPNVWFLAGTFGGSMKRTCSIPQGKGLFFPIITCAFVLDQHLRTESDLVMKAKTDMDNVKEMEISVDNLKIDQLVDYRIRTEPFDDIVRGRHTKEVSDGYWIFLEPLDEGNHVIHFHARNIDFFTNVTYDVLINPKR